MERKHKVLLKYLARLTFEGAEEELKERIHAIAEFWYSGIRAMQKRF